MQVDSKREGKLKELLAKVNGGDGLTDLELSQAIEFYTELEWRLQILGPRFHHAWLDIHQHLMAFEGFKQARERKDFRSST